MILKLLLSFSVLLLFLFLLLFPTFSNTSVHCTCVQCTVGGLSSFFVFLLFLLLFRTRNFCNFLCWSLSFLLLLLVLLLLEPSASTSSTLILFTSGFSSSSSAFLFNVTSAAALYSSTSLLDSYLSNLALCLAVAEILVTSPPSSCRMRDSTLAL